MTRYTTAYESGFLARFTATVTSAVPEFDPGTNPIGHALAMEIFAPAEAITEPVVEDADTGSFGEVVELPVAVSAVEWFEATTEPDEDDAEELDEPVRRAG